MCSKIHCCVSDKGSHLFMKIFFSAGLQSMQLLLTGWNKVLSYRNEKKIELSSKCQIIGSVLILQNMD